MIWSAASLQEPARLSTYLTFSIKPMVFGFFMKVYVTDRPPVLHEEVAEPTIADPLNGARAIAKAALSYCWAHADDVFCAWN
mmetsp:Transcript_41572/g.125584  ORF Transcript_41572/g.125584 Transcript_41572/m.125584 type:complete len:82 (-) Transcript_41572:41-286(-)